MTRNNRIGSRSNRSLFLSRIASLEKLVLQSLCNAIRYRTLCNLLGLGMIVGFDVESNSTQIVPSRWGLRSFLLNGIERRANSSCSLEGGATVWPTNSRSV